MSVIGKMFNVGKSRAKFGPSCTASKIHGYGGYTDIGLSEQRWSIFLC